MAEPDFATKVDGYWGGYDDVARIDELIIALGLPAPSPITKPKDEV